MDGPLLVAVISLLAAPLAALATWFLNRKKHIADIYTALSESSHNAVETMQMTMNELRLELVESRVKIEELIEENKLLRKDLSVLKTQNQQLLLENRQLEKKIEELSQQIRSMKR